MKQSWKRPEIIVLMRKKTDEVLLSFCKEGSGGAGGVNSCSKVAICTQNCSDFS
jgi:hypothetical protein